MLSSVRLYWCTTQPVSSEIGLQAPASQPFGHASRFQASPLATQIAAVDRSHCFVPGVHDTAAPLAPLPPALPVPLPPVPPPPAAAAPAPVAPPPLPPTAPSVVPLRLPPQPTSAATTAARSKIFIVMDAVIDRRRLAVKWPRREDDV